MGHWETKRTTMEQTNIKFIAIEYTVNFRTDNL